MVNQKIAHIIVGLGDGGAEKTLFKLIINDKKFNHLVISLTTFGKYGKFLKNRGIPVYCLDFKKYKINLLKVFKLIKILKRFRPNIIQSWMYHSDFVTSIIKIFFLNTKIIWNIRNSVYSIKDSLSRWIIFKMCSRLSYIVPNIIISNSKKAMKEHIVSGYKKSKFKIIYNGVDTKVFNIKKKNFISKRIKKNILNARKPFIGMVARFDKQKGHSTLIKGLNILNKKNIQFHFFLVGKNINYKNNKLLNLIRKNNIKSKITLLDQIEDIHNFYPILDLFILSSINGEGFPNVIIEAMACGIPCIVTNVGDAPYIVKKNGWTIQPQSPQEIANYLNLAIKKIGTLEWENKKIESRKIVVKNFSLKRMIDNFHKTWSTI